MAGTVDSREESDSRLSKMLSALWVRSGWVFIAALLFGLVCFGIELFNLAVSIDEEEQSVRVGPIHKWISQDRWGMYLLNLVLPAPVLPYITMIVGLLANASAAMIACDLWGIRRSYRGVLVACLIAGTPVLAFVMQFNTSQYGFFVGVLCAAGASAVYCRGGLRNTLLAWVLLVFAVSVYQAVAMVALVVFLVWLISDRVLGRDGGVSTGGLVRIGLGFGVWFGAGLLGHKLSSWLARAWFASGDAGYVLVDGVYAGTLHGGRNRDAVQGQLRDVLMGDAWYMGWQTGLFFLAAAVVVAWRLAVARRTVAVRVIGVASLVMLFASPFLLIFATGNPWPTRTLLAVPMMFAGLLFLATEEGGPGRHAVVRWVTAAGSAVVMIAGTLAAVHFAVSSNRLMYADHVRWWADRELATQIHDRLVQAGMPDGEKTRVAILGAVQPSGSRIWVREETIGGSIFEWDRGNPWRVAMLMMLLGSDMVTGTAEAEDYRAAIERGASMPDWPAPGSVTIEDGLAVIRFGEPTPPQLRYAQ